jgi:hypothetical protein
MRLITPEIKDGLLKILVNDCAVGKLTGYEFKRELLTTLSITKDELDALLDYFEEHGLIRNKSMGAEKLRLELTIHAQDFYTQGGFRVRDELLKANIEKLLTELNVLKKQLGPSHLETANRISGIAQAIMAGLGLMNGNS